MESWLGTIICLVATVDIPDKLIHVFGRHEGVTNAWA